MSRHVHPPVAVTVATLAGDWPGLLSYWRRDADTWRGFVEFSTGVGQQRLGWFPADELRPGEPLRRDEVGQVDVPLQFSDRPAVADRARSGQP